MECRSGFLLHSHYQPPQLARREQDKPSATIVAAASETGISGPKNNPPSTRMLNEHNTLVGTLCSAAAEAAEDYLEEKV
jgi:hypothetical protein